jgi:TolB-like protein/DNA-binding winged helix-turn-helix (wHTH) protein/Flp pilus assembly protein TadD
VGANKIGFDGWVLDPDSGDLERAGTRIRLQEQPLQVLIELIDSRGGVVTREQLISKLWPKGIVDFDTGLNTAIRKLRVALGDTADTPRYIETLPRRGYRFLAAPDAGPEPSSSLAPAPQEPLSRADTPLAQGRDSPAAAAGAAIAPQAIATPSAPYRGSRIVLSVVLGLACAYFLADWVWLSRRVAADQRMTPAATPFFDKSIAVLPFADMSEKKDQEYFADGLSEELIDMLTKVPELRVPARTSSFYFKGKQATIADIAKALGVAHVLEGSVRKSGNTLRITAQLVRADNGYDVWSETYDRPLDDIFKIQDEIAGAVVTALRVHMLSMQQPSAREELRTGNLAAYNLYLQGRQSYNQGDSAGYQHAATAFQAAIALDPRYPAAYADLALAQFWLTADETPSADSGAAGLDRALAAAEKAVALAPGLAAGYSARGFLRAVYRFDFAGAQADMDKAVALSPGDADILHRSAVLLAVRGKLPAAIAREEQALALDPLSGEICMRLGFFLAANQQLAQARELYEKALVIAPNSTRARYHLAELDLLENRPEQALAAFRQTGLGGFSLVGQAKAQFSLGHVDVSQRILEQMIAKKESSYQIGEIYGWRGEKEQAFEWAERAYEERDMGMMWLKIDTDFRSLRGDARYRALVRKMNLPE